MIVPVRTYRYIEDKKDSEPLCNVKNSLRQDDQQISKVLYEPEGGHSL